MKKLFIIFLLLIACTPFVAGAVTLTWDAQGNWDAETKVVLLVRQVDPLKFMGRTEPVLGLDAEDPTKASTINIPDECFAYGKEYSITAVAFNEHGESDESEPVTYKARDRPTVLEYDLIMPQKKPDTIIIRFNSE